MKDPRQAGAEAPVQVPEVIQVRELQAEEMPGGMAEDWVKGELLGPEGAMASGPLLLRFMVIRAHCKIGWICLKQSYQQ